jgi:hypothetical protein
MWIYVKSSRLGERGGYVEMKLSFNGLQLSIMLARAKKYPDLILPPDDVLKEMAKEAYRKFREDMARQRWLLNHKRVAHRRT